MKTELYNYDVFPKVMEVGKPTEMTIRPLGLHAAFPETVTVKVFPLQERIYPMDETPRQRAEYQISPCEDGCLRFTHTFYGEQEHYIVISTKYKGEDVDVRMPVYSVEGDLVGKIPLMGDLHLHTIRSADSKTLRGNGGVINTFRNSFMKIQEFVTRSARPTREHRQDFGASSAAKSVMMGTK